MIDIITCDGLSNCYVINFKNGDDEIISIIIDPSVYYKKIIKYIKGKIKAIILTHGHYDHFSQLESFINGVTYDIDVYFHKNAFDKLQDSYKNCSYLFGYNFTIDVNKLKYQFVSDKIIINYPNGEKEELDVIYTPGHTDCSITIKYDYYLFTGDFIFKNSIGRTDLYSGDFYQEMNSLKYLKSLIKYDSIEDYYIYPGHDAFTTLKDELKNNFYLSK